MADNQLNKKELEELLRLSNLLEKNLSALDLENLNRSGNAARTLLNSLRNEAEEFTRDISSAAEGFRKVVEEINNSNVGVKEVNKSFNKLTSIVDKIQYHQKGISKLNEKDVEKLQQQAKQEKERLTIAANLLKDKKAELELNSRNNAAAIAANNRQIFNLENQAGKTRATYRLLRQLRNENKGLLADQEKNNKSLDKTILAQENIQGIISDQDFHYNAMMSSLDVINKNLSDTQKLLGLGGIAVEGINTALNKLGFGGLANQLGLDEAKEKMEEIAESIRLADGDVDSFSNKFKVLRVGISSMGKSLIENLKDPLVISGFLINGILDAFKSVDSAIGNLAKNFGISYNQAAGVSSELNDAANSSYLLNVTTQGLTEAFTTLNNQFGTFAMISNEALITFTRLTKEAGLSNEAASALFKTSILTGKEVEATTKDFLGESVALAAANGVALNQKQILETIKDVSSATLLTLGGQPDKLAKAVVQAKLLGTNLSQVEDIASSLLDFESSIANELSAELITGKDLNLERARLAAINGDIATVAEEIAKQVGNAADFTKMNVIQQEALAKSVGMTREDLAKSLMEREALAKLSGVEGKTAQERFNNLVKEVGLEEAKKRLGDEQLANMYAGQSVQERFTAAVEKLQEVFVSLVEPLMPVLDVLAEVFKIVGPIAGIIGTMVKYTVQWGKYLLLAVGAFKTLQFLGDIQYRRTVLTNVAKKTGLITDKQAVVQAKITSMLGKDYIADETKKNLIKEKGLLTTISENIQKRFGLLLDKEALLGKTKGFLLSVKDFAMEKASLAFKYTRNILEAGYNNLKLIGSAIAKSELLRNIGIAAMRAIQGFMSFLGPLGLPLGIAAAAGVAALGYKYMKGDDVMSEGGYGNRTLLTPKGSIALNNNDTVIAGTNLGGGKSTPPPQQDLSPLLEEMKALRQEQSRANSKPTIVENSMNGTRFGTSVAMNTYKIQ